MKKTMILLMVAAAVFTSCSDGVVQDIKVMTFNIRFDNPRDSINAWPNRAAMVAVFIDEQIPDLFGMQEVLWHQYEYLRSEVPGFGSVAAGRDDGLKGGEACPVFWRLGRFDRLAEGTFWLSATPDVPGSVGWGAALTRITTWVRLYDKVEKDTILFFNTHFDHISDSARVMSSGVLLGMVKEIAGDNRFVITGDFNARPESLAIARMKEGDLAVDSYLVSETPPAGVNYTFNGWKDEPGEGRIDYIFVRNGMKVMSHETHRVIEEGVFISDHWPVTAVVK
ncbi:MAG: endonuclease/exonuclease/phosphatase family protein [Bacteroidales bacterium]|jgi:endonuclease/exonuclease/phosphatase family metal-dependent hydrolase|nr:endonuclease/exonuclease/phosphatase family protein [Bacteroidales bacterium]